MAKVVFLLRSVFFLLWPLLLNILLPRGTEILGKHLSKWGIICKSPIWEQWAGGGIATYVVLDQFPQATTRCAKKQMFKENQKQNINPYQTIVHRGAIESFCISCNQPSSQMTGIRVDRPSLVSSHL